MDFLFQKFLVFKNKLRELSVLKNGIIDFEYQYCDYKTSNEPPKGGYEPYVSHTEITGVDKHFWIHFTLPAHNPTDCCEKRLCIKTGLEGLWDATNPQFTVFINGKTVQAFDTNHTWLPLLGGKDYDVYIYGYTGMISGTAFPIELTVKTVDLRIEGLYYDIDILSQCLETIKDEKNDDYINIKTHTNNALLMLDMRDFYSEEFYDGIRQASEYLKKNIFDKNSGLHRQLSSIGHTHIDVAWKWTVAQTKEKAQRSFSTVLNLMDRYPEYMFMSSQPQLYAYVKEQDPELYERIKQRVAEGRWEVEGAMWLEADTNLSGGESLIRQILFGKRFMKEEFGVDSNILWLPDVFGYSGALPQILKKCGVNRFMTAKMSWSETNKLPHDTFIWEGIDGSTVFNNIVEAYNNVMEPKRAYEYYHDYHKDRDIVSTVMLPFGYGDGGGGATAEMMEAYKRMKNGLPGFPSIKMEKRTEFFDKIEKEFYENTKTAVNVPKWVGEMYLEMHRGTYTSIAKNKKNNRKSELLYQSAENASVMAHLLCGFEYPSNRLNKNWENILLNQFHDIIPGSSIKQVYDRTDIEYADILKSGKEMVSSALEYIKNSIKTDGGVFVYNPCPFEASGDVTVDGKKYSVKNIPARGYKVVPKALYVTDVKVSGKTVENDFLKIEFNDKYNLVSVFDKTENREILTGEGNSLEVYEDYPRQYDAWEITDYHVQKKWYADDVASVEEIENGVRVTRKYMKSEIVQDITIKPFSKRVDFKTRIDWKEDHVLLKAAFPVDIHADFATYDIQFGSVKRPNHYNTSWDEAKFEVCAHKWADISEHGYGVSILNDCKYGYSIRDCVMRISLLKAASDPNPCADREVHEFTYSLYPHTGDFREGGTIREGYMLNQPLEGSIIDKSDGSLPDEFSFVSADCENVVIETVKKAENDDSVIIRMYEAFDSKTNVTLTFAEDFKEAYLCTMLEENIEKLPIYGKNLTIPIKNFEVVTLKLVK